MRGFKMLVVDWDFFFPNPMLSTRFEEFENVGMYMGWDHSEAVSPLLADLQWKNRASGFLGYGMELPRVAGWEGFWDRFQWHEDGVSTFYADSNLHAGRIFPSSLGLDEEWGLPDRWEVVSLYDAHHDCGYTNTGSYEEWSAKDKVSCEDWMLNHYENGSRLEVTYPAWRGEVGQVEPEPLVPVERRVDDGTTPDHVYDALFICRSGAWVPPWCDEEFTQFLAGAPTGGWDMPVEENWVHPRPDVLAEASLMAGQHAKFNQVMARMEQSGGFPS